MNAHGDQKKELDLLELETIASYYMPRCWKLNLHPVEEQQVLLTAESPHQTHCTSFVLQSSANLGHLDSNQVQVQVDFS